MRLQYNEVVLYFFVSVCAGRGKWIFAGGSF